MLESTFRCPGVGASREREVWARGFVSWDLLPAAGLVLSTRIDDRLRGAVDRLRDLAGRGDVAGIARVVPAAEHWRLWPRFRERTCFLDIESDGTGITAAAILDAEGPRSFLQGRDLDELPERLAAAEVVVTFNGAAFDLPVLRGAFESIRIPPAHIDLLPIWRRLGFSLGLKALEKANGLSRPAAVDGCDGSVSARLWREWDENRSALSLRTLVEYNLYDAIQLRPLLDLAYNRLIERAGLGYAPLAVFERAELLYDVSKILSVLP